MPRRSLATLFPAPRAVTLAGGVYLVEEFTLGDMAEVEAQVEARRLDPLGRVRGLLGADAVAPGDRHLFNEAFDLAEADPGDRPATEAEFEAEWKTLLRVALRRHHPDVAKDDDTLAAILGRMRGGEFAAIKDAVYRPDPLPVLCRALDRFCGTGGDEDDGPDETDWHALVDRVSRSHGLSYAEIKAMTRTQFLNALAEGKPNDEREARPGEDAGETHRKWTRWLAGEDDGDEDGERKGAN